MTEGRNSDLFRQRITEAPHWRVVIRPTVFVEDRIRTLGKCWNLMESSRVSLRGWDYPHVDSQNRANGVDWIESWCKFRVHQEYWRLYQSGQFLHLFSFKEDLQRDKAEARARDDIQISSNFQPSGYLDVVSTLWTITEIFEFAARLAEKEVLDASAIVQIGMIGVKNRVLFTWDADRVWWRLYAANQESLSNEWPVETSQLLAESSELALSAAEWFFERFQWTNPPRNILRNDQERLLKRRF